MKPTRRREILAGALVATVAFLPFLRGALSGASLYFRDLALQFLPLRRLALDGLLQGEVRLWNPYLHEGIPLSLPAVGYPLDLLQLIRPDEVGISLSLALHVPLAALASYALARRLLDAPPVAAAGGALVYALGGFVLSTVNLYVYVQAAAWAPLVVLALARVLDGCGRRGVAGAALVVAVALSTTGVEIAAQAIVLGLVLGLASQSGRSPRSLARAAGALALGALVAAPVLALLAGQVGDSARGQGFATHAVLAHSVHPFTLLQVVAAGLYGNLSNLANEWWGQNFFPRGFPYILSLYLGSVALGLAAVGAGGRHPLRRPLIVVAVVALVVSLGRWGGLAPLVDAVPLVRAFRYPVKAFFTVHLALALLVSLGLSRLASSDPRPAWTRLAASAGLLGGLLALAPLLPLVAPQTMDAFATAFFPPGLEPGARAGLLARVLGDAAIGGGIAVATALVAVVARAGRVRHATLLVVALLGGDLLRAGAGLNPMVTGRFFAPSKELAGLLTTLGEGRVFTCPFAESPRYAQARLARGADHEMWTFALALESVTPDFNLPLEVPTAMSPDRTMLVPPNRVLPVDDPGCRDLDALLPRLRRAGVGTVLSVDPLPHPELRFLDEIRPPRIAPLSVHAYRLVPALERVQIEPGGRVVRAELGNDRLEVDVEASAPATLVIRDGWARGWIAEVNGVATSVGRADERHRSVEVAPGPSHVVLRYRPSALAPGLAGSLLGLGIVIALLRRRRRPGGPAGAAS